MTIYIARELGSGTLGIYFVALAVVLWAKLPTPMGLTMAVTKRLSEGREQREYALAGVGLISIAVPVTVVALLLFKSRITTYIGISTITLVIVMFLTDVYVPVVNSVLNGRQLVHVSGLVLTPSASVFS